MHRSEENKGKDRLKDMISNPADEVTFHGLKWHIEVREGVKGMTDLDMIRNLANGVTFLALKWRLGNDMRQDSSDRVKANDNRNPCEENDEKRKKLLDSFCYGWTASNSPSVSSTASTSATTHTRIAKSSVCASRSYKDSQHNISSAPYDNLQLRLVFVQAFCQLCFHPQDWR